MRDAPDYEEIGARLRKIRLVLAGERSVARYSKRLGLSAPLIYSVENGHRRIQLDAAVMIAERFDVTLDYIYRGVSSGLAVDVAVALGEMTVSEAVERELAAKADNQDAS